MAAAPASLNIRKAASGVILSVRLTPKSERDAIDGLGAFGGETALKARVRALPNAGRANAALEKLIAEWLGLPALRVTVTHGKKSRLKQVAIDGDGVLLSALIATRIAAL